MQQIDKGAMGRRIRAIRLGASLRQWELAKLVGTTQSAVHKYEHGVVPEPRRLIELARIGGTSVEWVLTGSHWENGSAEQRRVSPDLLEMACLLRDIRTAEPGTVNEALRVVRDAVQALRSGGEEEDRESYLGQHSRETQDLLHAASRIQRAVLRRIGTDAAERIAACPLLEEDEADDDPALAEPGATPPAS